MNLQSRLDALTRMARDAGYFTAEAPCGSCGWPLAGAPRYVVLRVDDGRTPPTCAACGNYVDEQGEAVSGVGSTIVLEGVRLEFPPGSDPRDHRGP